MRSGFLLAGALAAAHGGSIVCTPTKVCTTSPTTPTRGQNFTVTIANLYPSAHLTSWTGTFAGVPVLSWASPFRGGIVGGALNLGRVDFVPGAGVLNFVYSVSEGAPPGTLTTKLAGAGATINFDVTL